jgi:two-component system response regulator DesR
VTFLKVNIAVLGRHYLILDAMAVALKLVPDFDAVAIVSTGKGAASTFMRVRPTVAVVGEGETEHTMLQSIASVRQLLPPCGIALLAGVPSSGFVRRAVAAGALSVVSNQARLPHLMDAIRGVATGCLTIDSALLDEPVLDRCTLTEREREILSMTEGGASTKEIAKDLHLAAGTVRNLTSGLMNRFGGRSRFDTARIAREQGRL